MAIVAVGRFNISDSFVFGTDLGYALGISPNGNDGGFYYKPMLGYNLGESTQLNLSYAAISGDGGSIANFGLGFLLSL